MIVNPNADDKLLKLPSLATTTKKLKNWLEARNINCDDYLVGNKATRSKVLDLLSDNTYDIIHYAGHIARKREDDMYEYALILNNKKPLFASTIFEKVKGNPIVFLNGCWGGKAKGVKGSSQAIKNMTDAFLGAGAQVVVGSQFELPEAGASEFAKKFYGRVLCGKTVGEAMREARKHVMGNKKYGATWACYVMYGDPGLRIIDYWNWL
jgi:CHAT domain-containing protein